MIIDRKIRVLIDTKCGRAGLYLKEDADPDFDDPDVVVNLRRAEVLTVMSDVADLRGAIYKWVEDTISAVLASAEVCE